MWRKSAESKPKSSPGASPSPDPSAQQPGGAVPFNASPAAASVSHGIKIKGEISGQGDFLMDGEFEGTVHLPDGTFTVGPNARVTAEIEAREIIVRGEMIGTLKARERVHIWSTGKLTGDMDTRGIVIEDGAILHSKVAVPHTARQISVHPAAVPEAPVPEAAVPEHDQAPQPATPEPPPRARRAAASAAPKDILPL